MTRLRMCAAAGAAALVTGLASARAFAHPFPDTNHYLPVGLAIGGAIHPVVDNGFLIGGEFSYARLNPDDQGFWVGGYVDALWDTGPGAFRFSTGPEIGWAFLGVDGGYIGQVSDSGYTHGVAVRPMLTLAFITLAGRYGHLFGDVRERDFGEITVLLKIPIPIGVKKRGWLSDPPPPPPPPPRSPRKPLQVAVPPPGEEPPPSVPAQPTPTPE
jgi:hypothetical protein